MLPSKRKNYNWDVNTGQERTLRRRGSGVNYCECTGEPPGFKGADVTQFLFLKAPLDIAYVWNLKNGTNELIYRTEIESQMKKTNVWLQGEGRDKLGNWD